jgi:hypothetical protein
MRKFALIFLLAASTATPALAERDGDHGRGANWGYQNGRGEAQQEQRQQRSQQQVVPQQAPQPTPQPARNWSGGGGGWRGNATPSAAPPVQSAQPAPSTNWQGRRTENSGNWQRHDNGNWQDHGNTASVTPPPVARNDGRNWDGNRNDRHWDGNRPAQNQAWQRGNNGRWEHRDERADRHWDNDRRFERHDNLADRRWDNNRHVDNDRRWEGHHDQSWNRDWRRDRRYDWYSYRNQYRSYYQMPRYYNPYGWNYGYRRFSIGVYLDTLFFSNQYWVDDPDYYRLPRAPYGYRWVRYYDDVLLVDVRNGYVVDVIHDFFL